ncbi:MAG: peptidylprolyl isomerase [Gemmatimonadota bacterium]
MRRVWLVLAGVVVIAGCKNFRELFSAHADVAAEAAGQELPAQRLADIMGGTKGIRVTREAADFVANVWVDYTLFSQSLVQGVNLSDSGAVAETMWPQIAMVTADRWFDTVLSKRLTFSPSSADSVYNAGQLRIIQHILYTVPSTAAAADRQAVLRKAQSALSRIHGGADFGAIAQAESQDPGSARDSGYLPNNLWKRGSTVTAFDSAAWSLPPGGVSGLVETPYGYHILKRPTAEVVRQRLTDYFQSTITMQLDSMYRDSLALARKLELTGSAVPLMRAALQDPEGNRRSSKAIATYHGGDLSVADFLRWVYALPPQYVTQLQQAEDEQLKQIVMVFAQNAILLEQADSAHIGVTATEWAGLVNEHRAEIDSLRNTLGLGHEISDSSVSVGERSKLAALRLDTYFDDLVSGKARLRRMPATMSAWLRRQGNYKISEAGLVRAVELSLAVQAADSAAAADSLRPSTGDTAHQRPDSTGAGRPQ